LPFQARQVTDLAGFFVFACPSAGCEISAQARLPALRTGPPARAVTLACGQDACAPRRRSFDARVVQQVRASGSASCQPALEKAPLSSGSSIAATPAIL